MSRATLPFITLLALFVSAIAACSAARAGRSAPTAESERVVRRGRFEQTLVLTGEVVAESGAELSVPRVPQNRVSIRWLIEDGTRVKTGDKVAELDNTPFAADLKEKKLQQVQAAIELAQLQYDGAAQVAETQFDLERKRTAVDKARTEAALNPDVAPKREVLEKQLALTKAEAALAKAEEDLRSQKSATELDARVKKLALEKAAREIAVAEKAVGALTLTAPRDGILIVAEHPWEGRKLQVGDEVWVGFKLARIPDLGSLQVRAALSDVDDGKIAIDLPTRSTLDAYPTTQIAGKITGIAPVAREPGGDSLRRTFDVMVSLPGADTTRMRPGMSAKVEVVRSARDAVLLAPRVALDLGRSPARAWTLDGRESQVTLGACSPQVCVVESGLSEGTRLR